MVQVINKCQSLLSQPNIKGETPLHMASRLGHEDIVEFLIDRAKTIRDEQNDIEIGAEAARQMVRMISVEKDTALHEAVRNNHIGVVRILTREDPEFEYLANDVGETPLYLAAERGYDDIVTHILQTCTSPTYDGPFGRTALHLAVINKNLPMTRKILERNQNLTREVDEQGWTPLHHASHSGNLPIVQLLLQFDKSTAYIRDKDGKKTPLHIAALWGKTHKSIAQTIISHCPDCCEIVDERGRNALHFAVESRSESGICFLLQIPLICNLINQKDNDGNTPIHLLASMGFYCDPLLSHPLADKIAVNKQNLTAVDIILDSSEGNLSAGSSQSIVESKLKRAGCKRSLRNKIKIERNRVFVVRGVSFDEFTKAKDAQLIAATLIATVSFTAGFTMPGGYNSDKGTDQGIAILTRKTHFEVFLVSDTLALVFSTTAVLNHFLFAMQGNKESSFFLLVWASRLTLVAMGLMVLAFRTGICAALPNNSGLRTAIAVITEFCLIYFVFMIWTAMPLFQKREAKSELQEHA
ncbi:ankyrin repeat-containing protein At5g02620 [Jatropha curcas]|uniref:ankyrin repeat-containing protein At5g02620 n=1 Tax=Jatropha curcas TaxID=180498 RepID=UPI0018936189|nr:ankyrin repeat-containing protein At5g02620 [Jatropha curcas]